MFFLVFFLSSDKTNILGNLKHCTSLSKIGSFNSSPTASVNLGSVSLLPLELLLTGNVLWSAAHI